MWYINKSDMVCLLRWVLYGGYIISLVDAIFAARPQAIGIDFGPEMMCVLRIALIEKPSNPLQPPPPLMMTIDQNPRTVAHAYSSDNVTSPAIIKLELDDPYRIYLFRLRLEAWSDGALQALFSWKNKETSGISNAIVMLFERLVSALTCDSHDTANVSWVRQYVCSAWHSIMARLPRGKRSEPLVGEFTMNDVKDAFVDILTRLQEEARTTHNIDIKSTVITLPDLF